MFTSLKVDLRIASSSPMDKTLDIIFYFLLINQVLVIGSAPAICSHNDYANFVALKYRPNLLNMCANL